MKSGIYATKNGEFIYVYDADEETLVFLGDKDETPGLTQYSLDDFPKGASDNLIFVAGHIMEFVRKMTPYIDSPTEEDDLLKRIVENA